VKVGGNVIDFKLFFSDPQAHEHVLHDVFGLLVVVEASARVQIQGFPIPAVQLVKGGFLAVAYVSQQLLVSMVPV
jgi:hypothetical protein